MPIESSIAIVFHSHMKQMKYTLKIRIHRLIIITVVTLLLLILFRNPLLKATGQFLIYESELKKSEVIFVLSGGGFDRGNEAVKLYEAGWARKIVCTGGRGKRELIKVTDALVRVTITTGAAARASSFRCATSHTIS